MDERKNMTAEETEKIVHKVTAAIIAVVVLAAMIFGFVSSCDADTEIDICETVAPETISATETPTEEPTETPTEEPTEAPTEEPTCEATEAPVIEETEPEVDSDELEMLACVIYQEAGSDSICSACRYRVGDIVMNRVASDRFPNTLYGVLTQKGQYGKFSSTGIKWPSRAKNSGERHAVERAYEVARDILTDTRHSECYGEGYIWQAGFKQGEDGFWCCGHFYGR